MSFTAVHAERGRLDASLPDLGCGWEWAAIHRVRPPAPLACPECGHGMHAKVSSLGLRFFAHTPGAPTCALAEESMAHHLLKLELAQAARAAGWMAELEVSGPDGSWRADVLSSTASGRRIALEAQLASITASEIRARTELMSAHGVRSCWFSDRSRIPWLGIVPSVRLARQGNDLVAVEPMARFSGAYWDPEPSIPFAEFMDRLLTSRFVAHAPRSPQRHTTRPVRTLWASPRCVLAEAKKLREEDEQQRGAREEEARAERRGYARQEAKVAELMARTDPDRAALARHSARLPGIERAIAQLADLYRTRVTVGWSVGDSRYSCGVPLVNDSGGLLAVFDPLPQSGPCPAFLLDVGLSLFFHTEERRERFEQYRAVGERIRASYSADSSDRTDEGPPLQAPPC
ncbi:competence protein CoiA family protein [Streptomyces sp. NBC_01549]|uniref:competence protein CoiA n=1 Tax=unclassified Streptomyces TaxID=2593676 RepID=UPI002256ED6A|nr:competence protein CoiA family protein [Streptomyces sp. NBC_01549]MCX4597205.1 competence protein CoiA family protein [Streptomyces sp. NBC_01549]